MKRRLTFGLTAGLTLLLATGLLACNTVRGIGKDIEKGGAAVQRAASDVSHSLSSDRRHR